MTVSVFISYSPEDADLCQHLKKHLSPLKNEGRIDVWTDERIVAGDQRSDKIDTAFEQARLLLLLVSPDFLDSEFCTVEMELALQRHRQRAAVVVPVILRPCDWRSTDLRDLQELPRGGSPIQGWSSRDAAFEAVVKGLHEVLQKLEGTPVPESVTTAATATAEKDAKAVNAESREPGSARGDVPGKGSGGLPYNIIVKALEKGNVILFLGSGAALYDREADWTPEDDHLPRGDELAQYLAANCGVEPESSAIPGPLSWVSQCFEGVNRRPTLDDVFHDFYARAERPGRLHRLLVRYPGLVIVTLGWDRLLEAALREEGQRYHRVVYRLGESSVRVWRWGYSTSSEEAPSEVDLELDDFLVVFQLYGVAEREETQRDRLIVTERDYVELVRYLPDALPSCFARPFKKRHHLVLGCDLGAWNERVILDQMWQTWPRERSAWAIHQELPPLEREHWSREHKLTIFPVPLSDFVDQLEREAKVG